MTEIFKTLLTILCALLTGSAFADTQPKPVIATAADERPINLWFEVNGETLTVRPDEKIRLRYGYHLAGSIPRTLYVAMTDTAGRLVATRTVHEPEARGEIVLNAIDRPGVYNVSVTIHTELGLQSMRETAVRVR